MKKLLAIILSFLIVLSLTACGAVEPVIVNVENEDDLSNSSFGKSAMMHIGNGLWYDSTTGIVYWWNGTLDRSNYATTPSPYYAPNGLPYRYDPEKNMFKEIKG